VLSRSEAKRYWSIVSRQVDVIIRAEKWRERSVASNCQSDCQSNWTGCCCCCRRVLRKRHL